MSGTRVLVVDDEAQILRALETTLRGAGYVVDTATTAAGALTQAAVRPPDAVILDLILPDGTGTDVCRQLREWTQMPILILSAVGDEREKVAALDAGADDYVTKPFGVDELLARLRASLRRTAPPSGPAITIGELEIDLEKRALTRDGEPVQLTPHEYGLLRLFALNVGKLLTHRTILREVWGPAYQTESHYLHVYISQLRRKIEPEPTRPRYLLTESGAGYRFVDPSAGGAPLSVVRPPESTEPGGGVPARATAPPEGRLESFKRFFIGRPLATHEMPDTLLSKLLALPIFSSDPLSSVAYATEAALLVLVSVSLSAAHLVFPISIGIAVLLAVVVLSYRQVVTTYQSSGGAYIVAKENLGRLPSLIAGAALLTDYVLTVAVSVAAGIFALTSVFPGLAAHKVGLSLACVAVIAMVNLRGVREAGFAFAVPTYGFIVLYFVMVGTGLVKCAAGTCPQAVAPNPIAAGVGTVTVFVILRAFASGSTALTGVEAIANGVNAFRHPQGKNAARTLVAMGAVAITLFLGVSYLAVQMHARPDENVSVVSEIARAIFPASSASGFLYYLVQAFTLAILVLAANTSYQGFPRLAALMARDGFFPRQFTNLGDRLVFSNGIAVLTAVAALLIWAFDADVNSLIHLYVIGVFTAFTLSQAGMVRHWFRVRSPSWQRKASINGFGAAATGLVTVIVIATKFVEGAWIVMIAIPILVMLFYAIHRHYRRVGRRLRAGTAAALARPVPRNTTVLYAERLDDAAIEALWYARTISGGAFRAVHAPFKGSDSGIGSRFFTLTDGKPRLEILSSDDGPTDAVLEYLWALPHGGESEFVTAVIPELFRKKSLVSAVMKRRTFALKLRLLSEPGLVVTDVPRLAAGSTDPLVPGHATGIVLLSGIHAASLRAIAYARTLELPEIRAVFFAFSEDEERKIRDEWDRLEIRIPLEIVYAQYRDLGDPLLLYLRRVTENPDAVAVVIMPELIVRGWWRFLHNQRAFYIKRMLLFEPRVILTSVPYQMF